jgi:hypothetical protein
LAVVHRGQGRGHRAPLGCRLLGRLRGNLTCESERQTDRATPVPGLRPMVEGDGKPRLARSPNEASFSFPSYTLTHSLGCRGQLALL